MGIATESRATVRIASGTAAERSDALAVEAPLTIILDGEVLATTMRTPGDDLELAAGWLVAESGVRSPDDITAMGAFATRDDDGVDTVRVALADAVPRPRPRAFVTTSACGVCSADVIAAVTPPAQPLRSSTFVLDPDQVPGLLTAMRDAQRAFDRTGALHAAALVDPDGSLLAVREDVGRHNAVDKAIGWALLDARLPLADHLLLVSGRVSFEIVQKALAAGLAGIIAVSGPTTLAVDLAREHGMLLIGFVRDGRMNVYSEPQVVHG